MSIHKDYDPKKLIKLTELGEKITESLILTLRNPIKIGVFFVIKHEKSLTIQSLFENYFPNSMGNYGYMESVISNLIEFDLIYLE